MPLVVKRYKAMMDEQYKGAKHNPDSLEAYIATSITLHTMKKILREDPPVTVEKLMKYIEAKTEHQDIKLDFNPNTRELINTVWLDTGEGEWIKKTPADKLCL